MGVLGWVYEMVGEWWIWWWFGDVRVWEVVGGLV